MKLVRTFWVWLKPVDVPPAPAWVARVGWAQEFPTTVRYTWDRIEGFDSWEDAGHWLRCLVEDQTPHSYTWLKMPPGMEFEYRSPIGQTFKIERG